MRTQYPTYYKIICPTCGEIYYDSRVFYEQYNENEKYCKYCGLRLITKHFKYNKNEEMWCDKPE